MYLEGTPWATPSPCRKLFSNGWKKFRPTPGRSLANMEVISLHIATDNPAAATQVIQSVLASSEGLIDFSMLGHAGQKA